MHEVSAVRAQLAYGRQLSCSPDCEGERRRRSRAGHGPLSGLGGAIAAPSPASFKDASGGTQVLPAGKSF